MIVFFDIGSTLIDGPPQGPARRLSDTLGLGPEAVKELERILFRSPASDPEQLANTIVARLRVDFDQALGAAAHRTDLFPEGWAPSARAARAA